MGEKCISYKKKNEKYYKEFFLGNINDLLFLVSKYILIARFVWIILN